MNSCWNCEAPQSGVHTFCVSCGSPLQPEAATARNLHQGVVYLLREMARWPWLDESRREALSAHYQTRLERLKGMAAPPPFPAAGSAPPFRPAVPAPPAESRAAAAASPAPPAASPAAAAASPAQPPAVEPATPAPPPAAPPIPTVLWEGVSALGGFLEERNIRWFQILGGLITLAAFVGILMSQWSRYGSLAVMGILLAAPLLSFAGAWTLRGTLPLSSRLLWIVGGLLLPVGLLGLRQFGLVPSSVSWDLWACLSFAASTTLLLFLCALLAEPACLYLGSLSGALAADYLQRFLWSGHALFGITMLAAGFVYLFLARAPGSALGRHLLALSQMLVGVGLMATLPYTGGYALDGPVLFFAGAAFFATAGYLFQDVRALYFSAVAGIGFAAVLVIDMALPSVDAGFALIVMGAVYAALGRSGDTTPSCGSESAATALSHAAPAETGAATPSSDLGTAAFRLGAGVTAAGLVFLFGLDLMRGILNGFDRLDRGVVALNVGVAVLAAIYYATVSVLYRTPRLVYAATAALAWAEFMAVVWLQRGSPTWFALALALFPLATLLAGRLLRPFVPAPYLEAAIEVALVLSFLPGPLALGRWALGAEGGARLAPWVSAVLAAFYVLVALWQRRPTMLYMASLWGVAAWASALKPSLSAYGIALLPLAFLMGWAALRLEGAPAAAPEAGPPAPAPHPRSGRAWSLPLARSAWLLLWAVLLLQPALWLEGERSGVAATLLTAMLGTGLLARRYAGFALLDRSMAEVLAGLSALLLPAAVYTFLAAHRHGMPPQLGMLAVAFGMVGLAHWTRRSRTTLWPPALRNAALAAAAVVALAPDPSLAPAAGLAAALIPAALWMLAAILESAPALGVGSSIAASVGLLTTMGSGLLSLPLLRACLLAVLAAGNLRLAALDEAFVIPAWAFGGYAWAGMLAAAGVPRVDFCFWFIPFNAVLAAAWRRWPRPVVEGVAVATAVLVLGVSCWHGAPAAAPAAWAAYAAAFGWVAWRRRSTGYALASSLLMPAAWILLARREGCTEATTAVGLALLALAWLGIGRALRPSAMPAAFAELFLGEAAVLAFGAGLLALDARAPMPMLLAAAAMALQGALRRQSVFHHVAFGMCHLMLLRMLEPGFETEWATLPPALWILLWSRLSPVEQAVPLEQVGCLLALLPSLLLSAQPGSHVAVVGVMGLALVLYGAGARRGVPLTAGSLALLGEGLIQIHRFLAARGWQIYASVVGPSLILLGVLFERKRQQLMRLGQRIAQQISRG